MQQRRSHKIPNDKAVRPRANSTNQFRCNSLLTQGELKTYNIMKWASRYLHSNVIEITNANINTFLGEHPSVPKVLLFSEKKGVPIVYKGLSVEF